MNTVDANLISSSIVNGGGSQLRVAFADSVMDAVQFLRTSLTWAS